MFSLTEKSFLIFHENNYLYALTFLIPTEDIKHHPRQNDRQGDSQGWGSPPPPPPPPPQPWGTTQQPRGTTPKPRGTTQKPRGTTQKPCVCALGCPHPLTHKPHLRGSAGPRPGEQRSEEAGDRGHSSLQHGPRHGWIRATRSLAYNWHPYFLSGIAGTTFGALLVLVLYVLMPNNNVFLHPDHWYDCMLQCVLGTAGDPPTNFSYSFLLPLTTSTGSFFS